MEDDADSIVARVYPKQDKEIPLSEQTVAQVNIHDKIILLLMFFF